MLNSRATFALLMPAVIRAQPRGATSSEPSMLTGPERGARQTCRCRRSAGNGTDGTMLLSGRTLREVPEHCFLGIGDIAKMNLIPTFPVFRPIGSVTPDEARHRAVAVKLDQQAAAPGQEP